MVSIKKKPLNITVIFVATILQDETVSNVFECLTHVTKLYFMTVLKHSLSLCCKMQEKIYLFESHVILAPNTKKIGPISYNYSLQQQCYYSYVQFPFTQNANLSLLNSRLEISFKQKSFFWHIQKREDCS